jgi:hypothetical protein
LGYVRELVGSDRRIVGSKPVMRSASWLVIAAAVAISTFGCSQPSANRNGQLRVVVLETQDTPTGVPDPAAPKLPETRARVDVSRLPFPKGNLPPPKIVLTNAEGVARTSLPAGRYSIYLICAARNPLVPEIPGRAPRAIQVVAGRLVRLQFTCATPSARELKRLVQSGGGRGP